MECIVANLGVHTERLSKQRKIKVNQCQQPVMTLTKKEVTDKKLVAFVLHPAVDDIAQSASEWWEALHDDDEVEVKYPYDRHGLAGKSSNNSKPEVRDAFLQFVDANSHPNGRHAGSYSALFYFIPKFTRIDPPKVGEKDFDTKAKASLVWVFNHAQEEAGKKTCSAFAARQWLKELRPKLALHPHKSDYCDTCKYLKEEISRQSAVHKRLMQAGSAQEQGIRDVEAKLKESEEKLHTHKEEASAARDYYNEMTQLCSDKWSKIMELSSQESPSQETAEQLTVAQHTFTLVLSADYQQNKLIPYWGRSEQPGSTYYLQKVSYDIFGLVDHRNDSKSIIIFDETVGPKNTDHTISFLSQYVNGIKLEFPWIDRVRIFLDNAGNTNKNRFLFSWGMEVVSGHTLDHIRFCFLVAGHTKFAPDRLFSSVANQYNREDVFTADELLQICQRFAAVSIEDGSGIFDWRSTLKLKYTDLAGVRKLHDFLIVRAADKVVMKVRESCYRGIAIESPLRILDTSQVALPTTCYSQHRRQLAPDKMSHLAQMYTRFVPPERWPGYIDATRHTPTQPTSNPVLPSQRSASPLASTSQSSAPLPKKPRTCNTPHCDGSGHKNKKRWSEGHTTRAGCPRITY